MPTTTAPASTASTTAATAQIATQILHLVAIGYTVDQASAEVETAVSAILTETGNSTPYATAHTLVATAVAYLGTVYGV